jgi:ribosomal protein L37AE/L43A
MIRLQEIVGLPTLQYHLDNKLTLSECVYRYSSDSFVQLFSEARQALRDGKILLNEQDLDLLENTDIGEYGMYEGQKVALDLPMIDEEIGEEIICKKCNHDWEVVPEDQHPALCHKCGYDNERNVYDIQAFEAWKGLQEAEYKGRNIPLNKPKRGGPKKFYVYVKNPKTGNVKKVNFGDSGNLTVKLNEPGARAAFAARHKCAAKKDKTSPGYWSCNIGRYWKSLGGSKNFSGYW